MYRTKKKSELKLYTACLPSEVKLKPQASNVKETCYVDALFMLPKSQQPNCNPYCYQNRNYSYKSTKDFSDVHAKPAKF